MTQIEVTVFNPDYWVDKGLQLAQLLGSGRTALIQDPSGRPPDPETTLTFVDPEYWSTRPQELAEALKIGAGIKGIEGSPGSGLASGAGPAGTERLTLSVEEAAAALGISRAFAYESVRRGDIPHIKIGRRLLIPRVALELLLQSANPRDPDEAPPDP